jgi:hypothetical protein
VPFVFFAFAFARTREWLAGTRSGPNGNAIWPSGKPQGERPSTDAGEEMADCSAVFKFDFPNVTLIDPSRRNMPGCTQLTQPRRRAPIEFVVVNHQSSSKAQRMPYLKPSRFHPDRMAIRFSPEPFFIATHQHVSNDPLSELLNPPEFCE